MVISLYFHIPFCTKKCPYCHFFVVKDSPQSKKSYLTALKKEWEEKRELLEGKEITSIYFGGGTPSLLTPQEFSEIFSFFEGITLSHHCEITLEANPESLTSELLRHVKNLGVNRISLGVQSFDNTLLITLGRTHNASKAYQAIDLIQSANIKNISIDLMYDLPNQTVEQFEKTVIGATTLPITHISLYNLTIEPHTSFYRNRKKLTMPRDEESLAMLEFAISHFEANGFKRYEISAFAKPSFESRHNRGYWLGRPFLGYGPSAFSYWDQKRFSNVSDLMNYERLEDKVNFSERLPARARYKELLAIRLRVFEPFKLTSIPEKIPSETFAQIQTLIRDGYIARLGDKIYLTSKGALFYDYVAETLIEESEDELLAKKANARLKEMEYEEKIS